MIGTTTALVLLDAYWMVAVFVSALLATIGILALVFVTRRAAERVVRAMETIVETSDAICNGASAARITIESNNGELSEIQRVYHAVNRLADKQVKDIQELKRLENMRSEFLANVSHELRTPIFSIQGFLETLLDGAMDDESVRRQFVEKAYSNTMRLNVLLTDLIDISRIESGAMRFSFRYFSIFPLIDEIFRNLEPAAEIDNITLAMEVENDNGSQVYGDRDRIAQVLTNLIVNAIKYNVPGGKVTVVVERIENDRGTINNASGTSDEPRIRIGVRDTGIGITPEHQKRIFERFYRVDKARSRDVGGTGLGLAIVKHIVEAHKSSICVESESGKGTCISFTLKP